MKKLIAILLFFPPLFTYSLSKSEVYRYVKSCGIQKPEIVMKQILLETGNLRCINCSLRYNNLLGFYNGSRYLKFTHWKKSIDFYKRWQVKKGYSGGNYYEFLKRKWGAPNMTGYVSKLRRIRI